MPPEDFVSLFRDWYYKTTYAQCSLLERDVRKRENIVPLFSRTSDEIEAQP